MIEVQRSCYRGKDEKKFAAHMAYNRDANLLENHINQQITNGETGTFLYANIAREVGLSRERVTEILFSVECGSNGFTIRNNATQF